jgi:hypothetical protein
MAGGIPMEVCTGILIVSVRARCAESITGGDAGGAGGGDAAGAAAGAGAGAGASLAGDGDAAGLAAAAETDEASPSIVSSEPAPSAESGSELCVSSEEPSAGGFCLRA